MFGYRDEILSLVIDILHEAFGQECVTIETNMFVTSTMVNIHYFLQVLYNFVSGSLRKILQLKCLRFLSTVLYCNLPKIGLKPYNCFNYAAMQLFNIRLRK